MERKKTVYPAHPIAGKALGASGPWTCTLVGLGSLVAISAWSKSDLTGGPAIVLMVGGALLCLGLLNGTAMYFFSLISSNREIPTGAFMNIVMMCMLVSTLLLDWGLNANTPRWQDILATAMACGVVGLLATR